MTHAAIPQVGSRSCVCGEPVDADIHYVDVRQNNEPTLLMRVQALPSLGHSCQTVAEVSVVPAVVVLDSQWSYPAKDWPGGWPRKSLTAEEGAIVASVAVFVAHDVSLPPSMSKDLLNIIGRVSK